MIFDPLATAFQQNPYPVYARLRDEAPILWHAPTRLWYVSRYEDVSALLRDRRLGRSLPPHQIAPAIAPHLEPFQRLSTYSMFDMEPPDHTRLRGLISKVFTPRRVEALRPQVAANALALLQSALSKKHFDLLEDYAIPLPVLVIADLLGIPQADRDRLRPWSAAIVSMYELTHTYEQEQRALQAAGEFWDYLKWLSQARRQNPQDDLISALAMVTDQQSGAHLSEEELIATCILLLNAGHEATVNGFGNGMYAMFCHPEELARLGATPTPDLVRTCVEEMLRYDSPLQMFKRWVYEDMAYKDVVLHQGQQVALFFGSANRDPRRFESPDVFHIDRLDNPHISFSAGIHYCLGAPLARLELNTALETLIRHAPHLELASQPRWRDSFVIRGLEELQVHV